MSRRKMLVWVLTLLIFLFALLAWLSVNNAILIPTSSTWVVPMVWFSFYVIALSLAIMTFADMLLLELVLVGSLALSIFFAPHLWQLGGIVLGGYFLFSAARTIRRDMELNVNISPWKSLQAGKSYLLLALVTVICMQYFLTVKSMDGQVNVPKFDVTPISKKIVMPLLASFNPSFRLINDETLTVDQFILQSQEDAVQAQLQGLDENLLDSQLPSELPAKERELMKKQALESFDKSKAQITSKNKEIALQLGRQEFANMVGTPIKGDEKVSEIFAGLVDKKINDFFRSPVKTEGERQVLPAILAVILLLTIYPIASMLSILLFLTVKLLVFGLIRLEVLEVQKISIMKEVLK